MLEILEDTKTFVFLNAYMRLRFIRLEAHEIFSEIFAPLLSVQLLRVCLKNTKSPPAGRLFCGPPVFLPVHKKGGLSYYKKRVCFKLTHKGSHALDAFAPGAGRQHLTFCRNMVK